MSVGVNLLTALCSQYYADEMKTLTVREVPDEVYAVIRREAERNHRSLQEQVRQVLEKEARLRQGGFEAEVARWRRALAGRALGGTVADIRSGRGRR